MNGLQRVAQRYAKHPGESGPDLGSGSLAFLGLSLPARYAVAGLLIGAALWTTLLLDPLFGGSYFLLLLLGVLVSVQLVGWGPGLLGMSLSAGWIAYFMLPPPGSLDHAAVDWLKLAVFVALAVAAAAMLGRRRPVRPQPIPTSHLR